MQHYRRGRIFLAGDAAHIHSLIGGHGMNTGIQDAYNLAWKLALVLRGVVPQAWLDSYEIERRQVAENVLATTQLATQNAEMFAELSPQERARLCEHMLVPESERIRARRHDEELDQDYRCSPLCMEHVGEFDAGPHAGAQATDAGPLWVDGDECRFFDLLRGSQHRLLLFAGTKTGKELEEISAVAGNVVARHGHWIDAFLVCQQMTERSCPATVTCIEDPQRSLHDRYAAIDGSLYLIRPDGYIAYRSRRLESLNQYLGRVL